MGQSRVWGRAAAAVSLVGLGALALLFLLGDAGEGGEVGGAGGGAGGAGLVGARRAESRVELLIRSANLVVKDLAESWDMQHYQTEPFEFCGKKKLSTREAKVCADHFLTLLDLGAHNKTEGEPLRGMPDLDVYTACFRAKNFFQVKACVKKVTENITPRTLEGFQRTGEAFTKGLQRVGEKAVRGSGPINPVEGLNGGMSPEAGEMSTADYSRKLDAVGRPPLSTNGCEGLGVGGCMKDGGDRKDIKDKALEFVGEGGGTGPGR